jgi:hypothetical protein
VASALRGRGSFRFGRVAASLIGGGGPVSAGPSVKGAGFFIAACYMTAVSQISPPDVRQPPRGEVGEGPTRRCYACREQCPVVEFAPDPSKGSGFKSICRPCDRAKSRRYYRRKTGKA